MEAKSYKGPDLAAIATTMRLISGDCATDAEALDRTPFTSRGMGETFGSQLAMIASVAKAIAVVADEVQSLRATSNLDKGPE